MATLNKVMLIGRLTDNPEEPRTLPNSGSRVVKFRFAVGRSRKNEQGQWENDPNPLYIDCEAFSRQDQRRDLVTLISQYVRKGDSLYIEGRLQLDQWEDKNGGGKRSKHKIVVDQVELLGSRNEGGEGGGNFNRGGEGGGFSRGEDGGFNRGGNEGGFNRGGEGGNFSRGGSRPAARQAGPPPRDDAGGMDYNNSGDDNGEIPF